MRGLRHWWAKIWRGGHHRMFCTCQVVAVIYIGRGAVDPGAPLAPEEIEVITNDGH